MTFTTRFAPSPTGPLHLGHAYSALLAYDLAQENGGEFLLRIEDIDRSRARSAWEQQIYDDLTWLGLRWPQPVLRQSDRMPSYSAALDALWNKGLLYPCSCSRRDIQNALSAPQEGAPMHGPDGLIYPGTCRNNMSVERNNPENVPRPQNVTLRLDMTLACSHSTAFGHHIPSSTGQSAFASFIETGSGSHQNKGQIEFTVQDMITEIGDIVVARRDMGTAYHLSVVVDDAAQGVTHVVRGQDLFDATKIHVLLQSLLNLPTPIYHHHPLIRDDQGKRLAKRDDARAIAKYRADGSSPNDIRAMVGL